MNTYKIRTECGDEEQFDAADDAAARTKALDYMSEAEGFDMSEGTVWYTGYLFKIFVDEDGDEVADQIAHLTYTFEPPEPDCAGGDEHDWQAPISVLGGVRENPGVWGHGGGVIIREVCANCGVYKETDTWAQNPDTGEQGLESVKYEPADELSLAWVEELAAD